MATINDVAREAGVSITTVSRVLNKNYPVKEATRLRVEAAIERLSFKPNPLARSLITGKSQLIGVIVPSITNWFFSSIVEDLQRRVMAEGYHIQLYTTEGDCQEEIRAINELMERKVDGLILIDPCVENIKCGYISVLKAHIEVLIIGSYDPLIASELEGIFYDERDGMRKALDHLLQRNKKRIALLRGEKSHSLSIRESLYLDLLRDLKHQYKNVITVKKGNNLMVFKEIEEIVKKMISSHEELPDGIIACNDLTASALIAALKKNGIAVPQEIGVIGYDNTPLSYITSPGITTVDLGTETLGERASEVLLNKIAHRDSEEKRIILNTGLILREST